MSMSKTSTQPHLQNIQNTLSFIQASWGTLTHSQTSSTATQVGLPHPFIVPSNGEGDFAFREQYYWDTYFTILGIHDKDMAVGMLENLIHLYQKFGLIPNASRYYLTSRSQPPVLTAIIFHIYDHYAMSDDWLRSMIVIAQDEYASVWTNTAYPHPRSVHRGLNRYFDINWLHDLAEAESGWDMTPRFKRQCLDYLPIDLNCLLYAYERDFERFYTIIGEPDQATVWRNAAAQRQSTVTELMWHGRKSFFFDYNYATKRRSSVWSLAAYTSMWSGLATEQQAAKLAQHIERFDKKGGLTTTIGSFMYGSLFGSVKTQWAYPNTWAPLQLFVIQGLERYGYHDMARELAVKWLNTVADWHHSTGEILEKYNAVNPNKLPVAGLYPTQKGFGWTNGVFAHLAERYVPESTVR